MGGPPLEYEEGGKKEGETLVHSGGRAQTVGSASHNTSWLVGFFFDFPSWRIHTRYFLSKPQLRVSFQHKQPLFVDIANRLANIHTDPLFLNHASASALWVAMLVSRATILVQTISQQLSDGLRLNEYSHSWSPRGWSLLTLLICSPDFCSCSTSRLIFLDFS